MVINHRLRRRLLTTVWVLFSALTLVYFGYHSMQGRYGLQANRQFEIALAEQQAILASLRQDKSKLEHRLSLLRAQSLDPDLLDENARRQLGFLHPNEVVLFYDTPKAP